MRKLIVNAVTDEERIALLEDGRLAEIFIKDVQNDITPGCIYLGRVRNVLPGLQAAFVDIGNGMNGYLHRNDVLAYMKAKKENPSNENKSISSFIREGEDVIVQIVKEGDHHKAPKLSMNLEFKSSSFVYKPFEHHVALSKKIMDQEERVRLEQFANEALNEGGLIIRTEASRHPKDTLHQIFNRLKQSFHSVMSIKGKAPLLLYRENSFIEQIVQEISLHTIDEIIYDRAHVGGVIKQYIKGYDQINLTFYTKREDIFSYYQIDDGIEKALKKIVWLKNGSYIVIEETEAMTVVDVNTGKFSGKYTYRDTVLQTNKEAASEIAKQLRLRNISGIILIDFIDMKDKNDQEEILRVLKKELLHDRTYTKIFGFTELNLLQLTRKKVRKSLSEMMMTTCPTCYGTGAATSPETVAFQLQRKLMEYRNRDVEAVLIETNPAVSSLYLKDNQQLLISLEGALKMKIILVPNPCISTFNIQFEGDQSELERRFQQ